MPQRPQRPQSGTFPHAELTNRIIGAAISVHRVLGPGLLESAYQRCLAAELRYRRVAFEREVPIPIVYRDEIIPMSYQVDFIVENKVLLELKAIDRIPSIVDAQVLTYLKLTRIPIALLLNFNSVPLHKGIRRYVNAQPYSSSEVSEVSVAT